MKISNKYQFQISTNFKNFQLEIRNLKLVISPKEAIC